jgi:hypothetical protein
VLLKNTQFWVDLTSQVSVTTPGLTRLETLPVLDNINPTREEGRAQVPGYEIEDVDDHTAQEGAVEHPKGH